MNGVIEALNEKKRVLLGKGIDDEHIINAEKELELKFSEEYKLYLREIKIASYNGHELTGLVDSKRVGVVEATKQERENNSKISGDMYVIERTGVEGVIIWQKTNGKIYYTHLDDEPVLYCESLEEYIRKY